MENFVVSARKYRPATFSDVVGQSSISSTLKNSIVNKHLGHAYLFSGPRGVGKTTCARIFARTINCDNLSPEGEACNECESCLAFNENRSYSIHELDAASNNSVDDIRLLTEQVRIPPQVGSYSIYIIDEVHMLSQQAFNAFLKTLEEPPAHAVFILATTEKHRIIPTILSRCQIFDFNRIQVEDTVAYLKGIAGKEKVEFEEDALHIIAQKADGAMRDALSIFDQVVSFSNGKITYQEVIKNLNILDTEYYFRITSSAMEGNVASMLLIFNEVLSKGFDARNFINGLAAHFRDLMVCTDSETVQLLETGAGFREKYLQQSKQVNPVLLYEGLEICNQADIQFRASRNQRLTIEMALVKLGGLSGAQKKKSDSDRLESVEEKAAPVSAVDEKAEATASEKDNAAQEIPDEEEAGSTEPLVENNIQEPPAGDKSPQQNLVRSAGISIKDSLSGKVREDEQDLGVGSANAKDDTAVEGGAKVSRDRLLEAWKDYAQDTEKSSPRAFNTLKNSQPEIHEEGLILLRLNSEVQKEHFLSHIRQDLLAFLRKSTGAGKLEIRAEVSAKKENGKKIYTDQDKLDYLIGKNPELGELKSRFNLDFDQ